MKDSTEWEGGGVGQSFKVLSPGGKSFQMELNLGCGRTFKSKFRAWSGRREGKEGAVDGWATMMNGSLQCLPHQKT